MVHPVRCLPHKHGDQVQVPKTYIKAKHQIQRGRWQIGVRDNFSLWTAKALGVTAEMVTQQSLSM